MSPAKRDNRNTDLVNEDIRFKEVRVVGANGEQLGILSRNEALDAAYAQGLDLYCVAAGANPPVCKILDYGKYKFDQKKKAREAKKNQQAMELKGLRLSPVIDTHDFETKLKQVSKWLEHGDKVKIDMRFRGRMITRQDVGKEVIDKFIASLSEVAIVEKKPNLEGNIMSVVLSPKKK